MDLDQILYTLAALFTLAAVIYFAWEYLEILPRTTKTLLLFGLTFTLFIAANVLRSHETPVKVAKSKRGRVNA
jgi:uncharacterized membrane protein